MIQYCRSGKANQTDKFALFREGNARTLKISEKYRVLRSPSVARTSVPGVTARIPPFGLESWLHMPTCPGTTCNK